MLRRAAIVPSLMLMVAIAACSSEDQEPKEKPTPVVTPTAPSPTGVERLKLADVEDARIKISGGGPDRLVTGFGSL